MYGNLYLREFFGIPVSGGEAQEGHLYQTGDPAVFCTFYLFSDIYLDLFLHLNYVYITFYLSMIYRVVIFVGYYE